MDQLNMFIPPVRQRDPFTSAMAGANVVKFRATSQKALLLAVYAEVEENGLIDEEAGARTGLLQKRACYWRRCSDLREANLIEPTGETRRSSQGELQRVCQITDLGRSVLDGNQSKS